ncbi:MAG: hypothetical protein AB7O38_27795, partial [Pirellulaceae bacterium]
MNNPHLSGSIRRRREMQYRCNATSVDGFIQQVAVAYIARGYWFYVSGRIPKHKNPELVDQKLIARYDIAASQKERCRRKRAGLANMQYIRHERFFLLMATHGKHVFFDEEVGQVRDVRRVPVHYGGYSLSYRNGRVSVRIGLDEYRKLKAWFLDNARRRNVELLAADFSRVPYQPYAPVRVQLLNIWRMVNRERRVAG